MAKKFKVQVTRYYFVTDYIEVEAGDADEAKEKAEGVSDNKDYTGNIQLDYVTSDVVN